MIPINTRTVEQYAKDVYAGKTTTGQVHKGMFDEYYKGFRKTFEDAVKPGVGLEYGPNWAFNQQIQSNLASFSAFKNHSNTKDLVSQLVDDKGNFKTFAKFKKDVKGILDDYNENWLQAEYQTATASGRMAEKWRNFQRRKATYPNLKYITQNDEKVRAGHKTLHHIIRPVDDAFWDAYYPPNGWRCRCDVQQTDEPVAGDKGDFELEETWKNNVGKNADLFPTDHPYKEESKVNKVKVEKAAELYQHQVTRTEVKEWAKTNVANKVYNLPDLPAPARMSVSNVKKILSQNHPTRPARNELLYILDQALDAGTAKLVSRAPAVIGKHPEILRFHYYELIIDKMKFYLNVAQYRYDPTVFKIYDITKSIYGFS